MAHLVWVGGAPVWGYLHAKPDYKETRLRDNCFKVSGRVETLRETKGPGYLEMSLPLLL